MSVVTAAVIGGVGTVAGAALGAVGAGKQASAAKSAAELQYEAQQNALAEQQREYNQNQQNEAPFLQAGQQSVTSLGNLLNLSGQGQGALAPWTQQFKAPTAAEAEQFPGYQFQLQQGEQALQDSASAQGTLLSGATQKGLINYGQNAAQSDYQQVYNNALQQYQQSYNQFQQNQSNTFNRLASVAGLGQVTAGQLGQQGQQAAQNTGNILFNGATGQGQALQNAGAATASGYNAFGNAASGLGSSINNTVSLANLLNANGNNSFVNPNIYNNPIDNAPITGNDG
jgi:hypothetical protein